MNEQTQSVSARATGEQCRTRLDGPKVDIWALAAMARATRGLARPYCTGRPGLDGPHRIKGKNGPARGPIAIRLRAVASREDEMETPLVRAPLPAPLKKVPISARFLGGPMAVCGPSNF